MNSYDQRFDTWIKYTPNPFISQNYSKSKIIKISARTLSLFLIFTGNVYKSWNKKIYWQNSVTKDDLQHQQMTKH